MTKILKAIFCVASFITAALGLLKIISFDISLHIAFICLGAAMIISAREHRIKGNDNTSMVFLIAGLLLFVITIYNLIKTSPIGI